MPLPSLYRAADRAQEWSVARAAAYGGAIGALAAIFKMLAPWREGTAALASRLEIVGAVLGFALLYAGAAALRNFIARRLVWR
jgi:hypothetical protein